MDHDQPLVTATGEPLTDDEVVARVRGGDLPLYEVLVRRHNARLFRIVRPLVQDDDEAEDVMQEAYVRAFSHLDGFEGRAAFGTWLARIAVNEAGARAKRRARVDVVDPDHIQAAARGAPEDALASRELRETLERAIGALPDSQRVVFVLRELGELSTAETAESLELSEEAVKVRLHRARASLRADLERRLGDACHELFPFHRVRCDRIVKRVFERIAEGTA